jgi:hypothetical protein
MSQATTQVKKVKGEGFKWGQELLKAKAIIAEQQEIMKKQQEKIEELIADHQAIKLQYNKQIDEIEELTDRANWTNEDAIQHLKEENYFVCKQEEYTKTLEELGARHEAQKAHQINFINQDDTEDCLYWGATCGYLTIWRLPKSVNVPDDCDFGDAFGNKWCLGEEWGGLMQADIRTITQKMVDKGRWEDPDNYSGESDSDSEDDEDDEEDLECVAWCKPISEGREPEERDADEFLTTKQKCPSCELERQEIIAETVQEMAVRIIAEQVKKQEENGEAEASNETEEGCCTNCGVFLDEDMHIFCYSRGEEEETMCCECGQDLHEELKADGWRRDDDSEDEDDEDSEDSEDDDFDHKDSCDICVKGWSKANEFGRCVCRCPGGCKKPLRTCRYECKEWEEECRLSAERVKAVKQE